VEAKPTECALNAVHQFCTAANLYDKRCASCRSIINQIWRWRGSMVTI